MNVNPMEVFLAKMIDDAPDDVVPAQVVFKHGVNDMKAGALRRGAVDGMFQLGIVGQATKDTIGSFRPGEQVVISINFTADQVSQVFTMEASAGLVTPDQVPAGFGVGAIGKG